MEKKSAPRDRSNDSAISTSGDGLRARIRRRIWGSCPNLPKETYAELAMIRDGGFVFRVTYLALVSAAMVAWAWMFVDLAEWLIGL